MKKILHRLKSLIHTQKKRTKDLLNYKMQIQNILFNYNDLKVVHAYARFYNFGDNALAYGIKNIFLKYFQQNIRFINEDVHTTIFDKKKLENINNIADIFLIGGGGLIHVFNEKYWLLNIIDKDIKYLKKPLILYGIGFNNFDNKKLNPELIKNIENIKNKATSFSIRNDGSVERLAELGLNFPEVPDPGFFVDGKHPKPEIENEYIMLQIAYDAPQKRNVETENFFNNMLHLCNYLIQKSYQVVLAPHCYPDIEISQKILEKLNNNKCQMWNWHEIMREDNVTKGLGYYKHAKFIIAMRGHAQICPIGMNVPVISIINHPKHLGILEKINKNFAAGGGYVHIQDEEFSSKIEDLITFTIKNEKEIKKEYKYIMNDLTNELYTYFEKLKKEMRIRR